MSVPGRLNGGEMIEESVIDYIEIGILYGFDVNRESVNGTEWSISFWLNGFTVAQYIKSDDGQIKIFQTQDAAVTYIHKLGYKSEITVKSL